MTRHALIRPSVEAAGSASAECPGKAITLSNFTDYQIIAKEDALAPR